MRHSIKKELLEGTRTYKFLIIISIFMFFALLNPILNKMVLPNILESQFNGISDEMLGQMVISSQRECVRGYLSDVFEISTIVIVLGLSSLIAGELRNKTFIFPVCSRKDFTSMVMSKLFVYGSFIVLAATVSVVVDYFYAGMLFGADLPGILPVFRAGLLQGLYYVFVIGLVMICGSFATKPITAGLLALLPAYGTYFLSQLFGVQKYTPAGLLSEANLLAVRINPEIIWSLTITVGLIICMVFLTVVRLQKIELARRT